MRSSLILAFVAVPSLAYAFADASQFLDQAASPHLATFGASGEGIYFTGARRFASLDCSSCHQGGPQHVGLRLNAVETSLFSSGYLPKHVYELQVVLTNEYEGLSHNTSDKKCTDPPAPGETFNYVQCNNNGFALEIDAADVALKGASGFCAQPPNGTTCPPANYMADEALVAPDADAVFGSKIYSPDPTMPKTITNNGATAWRFWWTAPPAGTGALTIYVAAVDGNGGTGNVANDQDPYFDDTVSANFFLQEANAPIRNNASAGCSVATATATPSPSWLLLVAGALLIRRARLTARRAPCARAGCRSILRRLPRRRA